MSPSLRELTAKEVASNQKALQDTVQNHSDRLDRFDTFEKLIKRWWPVCTAIVSLVSGAIGVYIWIEVHYNQLDKKDDAKAREMLLNKRIDSLVKHRYN